jgi:general stress protein 26
MSLNAYKSREEIFKYVNPLTIAILSTVSEKGKPYAAVIYFVVDHNLNFYFITKSDTKKSHYLEKNNNAELTILDHIFQKPFKQPEVSKKFETQMSIHI